MSGILEHWPEPGGPGAPLRYEPEVVEAALWEVALAGSNVREGYLAFRDRRLRELGIDPDDHERALTADIPAENTVRKWVKRRFRARYLEICQAKADQLDQKIAADATSLALLIEEGERRAVKQTLAGLAHADGVEASMIGRNLSQMKKMNTEVAGGIRGRQSFEKALPSLGSLAARMVAMGFARMVTVDGTAEELGDVELVEEVAQTGDRDEEGV